MTTTETTRVERVGVDLPPWQRVRWGAVFAGFVIALVTQMLLTVLGLAVGLTAVDPREGAPGSALGWGAAVWGVVSLLASLFVGGYVAGRLAGVFRAGDGAMNGVLVWALSLLGTVWLVSAGVGSLLSGAFSVVAGVTQAAGTAVAQGAATGAATGQDVTAQAERSAEKAGVDVDRLKQQAEQAAQQAEQAAKQIGQSGSAANQQARETAATATGYAATGLWSLLIAALLGLGVAAWGGAVGAREMGRVGRAVA